MIVFSIGYGAFAGYLLLYEGRLMSWGLLGQIVFAAACLLLGSWGVFDAFRSHNDRLVLNEEGVILRTRGGSRVFRWREILKARKIAVPDGEGSRYVIALQRKGELSYGPDQNSLDGFDVDVDDLLASIRQGQRLFGTD